MSLYRQLWITIVACTALAFGVSFAVSALGARDYLERQLAIKNADGAVALALSMSQLPKDRATLELQVATLFESGQYQFVRVRDSAGRLLAEKAEGGSREKPPIARLLPIASTPGVAEIGDGPLLFGRIELASLSDFADRELSRIALGMLLGFAGTGLLTGFLATWVLGRIRRPLAAVVEQANAISERRFVLIAEPRAPELKSLAHAMNDMVERIRGMFEEEAARLERMRHAANHDALTGLANREFFLNQLAGELDAEAESAGGLLLLVRLRDLAGINRRAGREAADNLLRQAAGLLRARAAATAGAVAGRLNGADLALLLPGGTEARDEAASLLAALARTPAAGLLGTDPLAAAGVARYKVGDALAGLLARADTALAGAEIDTGGSGIAVAAEGEVAPAFPGEVWRRKLGEAIGDGRMRLAEFPARRTTGELLHRECFVRLDLDATGEWLPAGRFLPFVARLELAARFDLEVARRVLAEAGQAREAHALNLSADSLRDPEFVPALLAILDAAPAAASHLWLEVPEEGALRHFDAFAALAAALHARGCKVGIERFGRHFAQIGRLYGLGLDYLKVDAAFIRGIDAAPGNQQFLKGLCGVAHNLGCLVIAAGVGSVAELALLPELGFDGATGPAVQE